MADVTPYRLAGFTEKDWLPEGGAKMEDQQRQALFTKFLQHRAKLLAELPELKHRLFAAIQEEISRELWSDIKAHGNFSDARSTSCPYKLWNIVLSVCITQKDAHDESARRMARMRLEKQLARTYQRPGEAIQDFKMRFLDMVEMLDATRPPNTPPRYTPAELALLYLDKLDRKLYQRLQDDIANDIELGRSHPPTVHDMH